jgi:branched-chain amino acid transport system substrate-binding protein
MRPSVTTDTLIGRRRCHSPQIATRDDDERARSCSPPGSRSTDAAQKVARGSGPLRRWRHARAAAAVAAVALFATACGGSAVNTSVGSVPESGPVKVGLLVPLTGPFASVGEDVKRGLELYLKQNDQKLGGRSVDVVVADGGGTPAVGIPAAQRLLNQDQVSVVTGVVSSAVASGIRDIFDTAKVPLVLSVAATSGAPSEFVWRTSQTTRQPGAALGPYLAKQGDIKSVYVIGADYVAGRENVGSFVAAYTKAGGKIAGESFTPFAQTQDWQPYLASIQKSGADAVYAFYAGSEAVRFVQQYDAFGLKKSIPLYGAGFLTDSDVLKAQGNAALGVRTSNNYSSELDNPANEEFVKAYKEQYGLLPSTYSLQSFDAVKLLDAGLAAVDGAVTGDKLAQALSTVTKIDSARGQFSFDDDNNPVQNFYLLEVVASSDGQLVNKVVAELGSVPAS